MEEKVILVDGNNLLFRGYYATAYTGNLMKNSKGIATNGVYAFVTMINKIIEEEKPKYILVAFDKGKTFRHRKYDFYKDGRKETPKELKEQFPYAKKVLDALGIKYLEVDDYEADDIIGTFADMVEKDDKYIARIISSDKDLLQLISNQIDVKLLKTKGNIIMNTETFKEEYGIDPIKIIDLKALSGDKSDNIPGVKSVGDKTALRLLKEYGSLNEIYNNIESVKGKLKEKLENDKENAFISYEMATICKEVPVGISFDDIKCKEGNKEDIIKIYEELEFKSFLKKLPLKKEKINFKIVNDLNDIDNNIEYSCYLEMKGTNYHKEEMLGLALYSKENAYYIPSKVLLNNNLELNIKNTYDYKKILNAFKWNKLYPLNIEDDLMVEAYLLNYEVKEDIAFLMNTFGDVIDESSIFFKKEKNLNEEAEYVVRKAKFVYDNSLEFESQLNKEELIDLYQNIEKPLIKVLADMEFEGIKVDKDYLNNMGKDIDKSVSAISENIYELAGEEFNISSPKQLGEILFDKLNLPFAKKTKTGYSTNKDVLAKLINFHPIIKDIMEYRVLTKLKSTYIDGLLTSVLEDGKIHTIYNQVLTRTGRLSSVDPNLQNIPMRYAYGRLIRKAFKPNIRSIIMSSDYSQVELRILASISDAPNLIKAFNENIDIHKSTASKIFNVPLEEVTKDMRSKSKAVNFGIIYGISSFGLSNDIGISVKEAKEFIDNYLEKYPEVDNYMKNIVKEAYEKGYVKTLMNRKRDINELKSTNFMVKKQGERIALNTPIQGISADILKKAMVEIYNEFNLKKLKSKMILQVHDELVFNVLIEEKEQVIQIVKEIMENTYKLKVPLIADINFGNDWYAAK